MLRRHLFCGTILPVVLAVVCVKITSSASVPAIDQAAAQYRLRAKQAEAIEQAIAILEGLLAVEPGHYDALWMQSRNYWYRGYRGPKKERLPFLEKAKGYAEQAVTVNGKGVEGHYWLAMAMGLLGQEKGILNCLFLARPIERELNMCIAIDPSFTEPYRALAELYSKAPPPPLSLGSRRKAAEMIRKAIALNPTSGEYWLLYAEIMLADKDYEIAQMALEKVLSFPDDEEDPLTSLQNKQRAKALLGEVLARTAQRT